MMMGSAKPGGLYRISAYSASMSGGLFVRGNETLSFGQLRTGCFAQSDILAPWRYFSYLLTGDRQIPV
jgi:hypothetical protein